MVNPRLLLIIISNKIKQYFEQQATSNNNSTQKKHMRECVLQPVPEKKNNKIESWALFDKKSEIIFSFSIKGVIATLISVFGYKMKKKIVSFSHKIQSL